ncbi:nacht nucleoside triphosphatase [Fusarium langsethiae]|uniref:Nacht nucleoside triphosphatase n=1 Tax=Fusarium langsethiae TaxID=179993 RepID=A0A0M9ES90_FUSLA|nr:nacht nucleoside triphosphatase [Fusarium langsethiae]
MSSTSLPQEGFRFKLRRRLNLFRQRSDNSSPDTSSIATSPNSPSTHAPSTRHTSSAASSETATALDQAGKSTNLTAIPVGGSAPQNGSPSATASGTAVASTSASTIEVVPTPEPGIEVAVAPSDLWSKAYREAVQNMGQDVDVAILKGENIAQLFKELEGVDKDATDESVFLRGVRYLHSIQVPLERFKLALDLTAPLTALEPTTSTVFGVIRGVTAVAISISTADLDFAKKIGEMLEQISYIDDCDTLGQRENRADIHRALVSVYQKLLEFYVSAYEFLSKRRTRLVLAVISDTGTLPDIVKDFLKQAEHLRSIVEKATLDIVQDIKAMLYDEKISQWLGHDKLSQQSLHHTSLQSLRANLACEFLLEKPEFKNWYRASDSQQLAILGDTGSGKSIMMGFLIDQLSRRRYHQLPRPMILYHYCQNDETGQALYIFSSLILSLLQQCEGLKKTFFDWYKQDLLTGNFEPSTNAHKLVGFFQRTVEELDRPLFLVVDGLDECDTGSRNVLLESLQGLSQKTSGLKVVLSSRPWSEILNQLDGIPKIYVGADPERDRIIAEKTVETKLAHLAADIKQLVVERLSSFAQGSAIWTKMTVEAIATQKIMARGRMKKFLDNMPQPRELSELYASLFIRCAGEEPEAQNMAATALEILGTARRRLSILELAWAVALGTADPDVTTVAEVAELVDDQGVMALIQPFVASIDFNDLKKHQVIVVHQSVKEFILNELSLSRPGLQNVEKLPTAGGKTAAPPIASRLENNIFNICVRYLLLDEINHVPLFSDEQIAIEELPQDVDLFNDDNDAAAYTTDCSWEDWEEGMIRYDPADRGFGELFVYASCHWINHFRSVTAGPLPDLRSVEKLCQANSTRLHNWTSQNSRPDCVVQARFEFDGSLYDPLSITSLYGSEVLLLKMLETSEFESHKFLSNTAMLAADQVLQWGDLCRLRMLFFGRGTGRHLQNLDFFRRIIDSWRFSKQNYSQDWDAAFGIINDIPDILIREGWGNELLCLAASRGCLPVIERLMRIAQQNIDLRQELLRGPQRQPRSLTHQVHQSIGEAVLAGHVDVVEYLLEQEGIETHLHHRNANGENVLHLASMQCNPAMFWALAPRFPDGISQRDCQGKTALMRVVENSSTLQNRIESAQALLSLSTTDQSALSTKDQQEVLQMTKRMHDEVMCNLLTEFSQVSLNG